MTDSLDDDLLKDDELLNGEDGGGDEDYDLDYEKEEALLQEDDHQLENHDEDAPEEDILLLEPEEELHDEDAEKINEETETNRREDKFATERKLENNNETHTINPQQVQRFNRPNKVFKKTFSVQKRHHFVQNQQQQRRNRTVLINPRYQGFVQVPHNNARLAWDQPPPNYQQSWPPNPPPQLPAPSQHQPQFPQHFQPNIPPPNYQYTNNYMQGPPPSSFQQSQHMYPTNPPNNYAPQTNQWDDSYNMSYNNDYQQQMYSSANNEQPYYYQQPMPVYNEPPPMAQPPPTLQQNYNYNYNESISSQNYSNYNYEQSRNYPNNTSDNRGGQHFESTRQHFNRKPDLSKRNFSISKNRQWNRTKITNPPRKNLVEESKPKQHIVEVKKLPEKIVDTPKEMAPPIEEEDEEMRKYRLKIEEQKRERERILRLKEERRLQAIKQEGGNGGGGGGNNTTSIFDRLKPMNHDRNVDAIVIQSVFSTSNSDNNPNLSNDKVVKNFLNNRKILTKDNTLLETRLVCIYNLSASTTDSKLVNMTHGIGEVEKIQMDQQERQATILFKNVASAHAFYKKYHRFMLDLSMIEVNLQPMV